MPTYSTRPGSDDPAQPPLPTSLILYERDDEGVPFAIEDIRAARWSAGFLVPPDPAVADVRLVRLARGPVPSDLPPWLDVLLEPPTGVAEREATYVVHGETVVGQPARHAAPRRLWSRSPHRRRPGAELDVFLRAGVTALRHPEAAPVDAARQLEAFHAFARGVPAFAAAATLHATALERWLHVTFREPEHFADAILVARVEATTPADAATLRFLREAEVAANGDQGVYADLAIDRTVLLERASAWRYVEGRPMSAAIAAVRGWQRRYARAYGDHYRRLAIERARVLRDAEMVQARAQTLARLNAITALGRGDGLAAIREATAAAEALRMVPPEPREDVAITGGIRLGAPDERVQQFHAAQALLDAALEARVRRLAAALAASALEAAGDDDLRAVLDAVALSEVDHVDRVLDDRLAARIDGLLTHAPRSPLRHVARAFPEVTRANLEAAVDAFRRVAAEAIDASPDGRALLAEPVSLDLPA